MDFSGPGFVVHGWWTGVVFGLVVLAVALGNWRGWWYLPVIPRLRGIDPPFLAGGQTGVGVSSFLLSGAELVPGDSGWHLALTIAGSVSFIVGGLGTWAYGSYYSVGPCHDS